MTFSEYLSACANAQDPEQRAGQWAFNLLYDKRPDLAQQVRATPLDPFYEDRLLPAFFNFVWQNW